MSTKITSLKQQARRGILRHFVALTSEDRRLRFGRAVGDDVLARYVADLDFARDGLFGVRDGRRRLVGVAHVAITGDRAEIGLSIAAQARGRGLGTDLFLHAAAYARERGVERIDMHFLTENRAMQRIAAQAGMRVDSQGGDSAAFLAMRPPGTVAAMLPLFCDIDMYTARRA